MTPKNAIGLVMAIRPAYVHAILLGHKTAEVRRRAPRVEPGIRALLYATAPVKAVLGTCVIGAVHRSDPGDLWDQHGAASNISRSKFLAYLSGAASPACLVLEHPARSQAQRLPFPAPQSYRYLRDDSCEDARLLRDTMASLAATPA